MTILYMPIGTTEYRRISVSAADDNGTLDPTGFPVEIAFTRRSQSPLEAEWHPATWLTSGGVHYARILVGPSGGIVLEETDYFVFVRITAAGETPVRWAGRLTLTQ